MAAGINLDTLIYSIDKELLKYSVLVSIPHMTVAERSLYLMLCYSGEIRCVLFLLKLRREFSSF